VLFFLRSNRPTDNDIFQVQIILISTWYNKTNLGLKNYTIPNDITFASLRLKSQFLVVLLF